MFDFERTRSVCKLLKFNAGMFDKKGHLLQAMSTFIQRTFRNILTSAQSIRKSHDNGNNTISHKTTTESLFTCPQEVDCTVHNIINQPEPIVAVTQRQQTGGVIVFFHDFQIFT